MEYTLTLSRATAALRQHGLLLSAPHCPQELTFPALTYDSRAVAPGALFVCKGLNFKPEYLQKALEAGALHVFDTNTTATLPNSSPSSGSPAPRAKPPPPTSSRIF